MTPGTALISVVSRLGTKDMLQKTDELTDRESAEDDYYMIRNSGASIAVSGSHDVDPTISESGAGYVSDICQCQAHKAGLTMFVLISGPLIG